MQYLLTRGSRNVAILSFVTVLSNWPSWLQSKSHGPEYNYWEKTSFSRLTSQSFTAWSILVEANVKFAIGFQRIIITFFWWPTRVPSSSPSPKDSVKPNSGIHQTFTS